MRRSRASAASSSNWVMGRPVASANLAKRSRVFSLTRMVVLMPLVYKQSASMVYIRFRDRGQWRGKRSRLRMLGVGPVGAAGQSRRAAALTTPGCTPPASAAAVLASCLWGAVAVAGDARAGPAAAGAVSFAVARMGAGAGAGARAGPGA
jgi:hypothetical protein